MNGSENGIQCIGFRDQIMLVLENQIEKKS